MLLREHYRRKELTIRRAPQKKDSPFSDSSTLSLHLILRSLHTLSFRPEPKRKRRRSGGTCCSFSGPMYPRIMVEVGTHGGSGNACTNLGKGTSSTRAVKHRKRRGFQPLRAAVSEQRSYRREIQASRGPFLELLRITPQRKPQRSTNLIHPSRTKLGHTPPDALSRHRNGIVQVHRTRRLHAVLLIQQYFRRHAANRRSDRRNRNCR